jgi:hypothetical protein
MRHAFFLLLLLTPLTLGGCTLLMPQSPPTPSPGEQLLVREQLIFHADFDFDRQHPLLEELVMLRRELIDTLALPDSQEPVHVYLYEQEQAYQRQAARYFPKGQTRRAFFVQRGERLSVYTRWGDAAAVDLRHEITHGYLHAALPVLPLWLDEGLAEYFELPPAAAGRHAEHLALLQQAHAQGTWSPDLARLEGLTSAVALTQLDYAESWLWTHWLLADHVRQQWLQTTLKECRAERIAVPVSLQLRAHESQPHRALLEHLASGCDR